MIRASAIATTMLCLSIAVLFLWGVGATINTDLAIDFCHTI
ncbi:MAG: hypothetical protein PUP92_38705 [Rhizonema sp. PD38]|nr:hypothetical protein [Rhizonema sp. PD38]